MKLEICSCGYLAPQPHALQSCFTSPSCEHLSNTYAAYDLKWQAVMNLTVLGLFYTGKEL